MGINMKKYSVFFITLFLFAISINSASAEDISIMFDDRRIGEHLTLHAGGMITVVTETGPGVYVKEVRAESDAPAIENYIEKYVGLAGKDRHDEIESTTREIRLPESLPSGDFNIKIMIVYDDANNVEKIVSYDMKLTVKGGSGLLGWAARNMPKDVFYAVKDIFDPVRIPRENPEMTEADLINAGLDEIDLTKSDIRAGRYKMELVKNLPPVEMKMTHEEAIQAAGKNANAVMRMEGDKEITVVKSAKIYRITSDAGGKSTIRAKVMLTVSSRRGIYDIETMEVIPKSMSESAYGMGFAEKPVIIEADPIVKWNFDYVPEDQAKDYAYITDKDIDSVDSKTLSKGFEVGAFAKFLVFMIKGGWILLLAAIILCIVCTVRYIKKGKTKGKPGKNLSKKHKNKTSKTKEKSKKN